MEDNNDSTNSSDTDTTTTMNNTNKILQLNQKLLDAIAKNDWFTYNELCVDTLTCFEPETVGNLVKGKEFHKFYFDHYSKKRSSTSSSNSDDDMLSLKNTTMVSPHVRLIGDSVAIVSYVRLVQQVGLDGIPVTKSSEETRVWEKTPILGWKNVHFHRS